MNKKAKSIILAFTMILSMLTQNTAINANEKTDTSDINELLTTIEPSMPVLNTREYQLNSASTLNQRSEWIDQVTLIQEEKYNQNVINVTENEDYIIFEFETNENVVSSKDNESIDIQIIQVSYLKPESNINNELVNENNKLSLLNESRSTYSTKIVEYYGWTNGYELYKTKSGIYSSIMNLFIQFVPTELQLVSWVVEEACGIISDEITANTYVEAQTQNKYYFRNKAGCVQFGTTWAPIAYVGQRRSFGWCWATKTNEHGEPILYKNEVKDANNSKNPTNYDGDIEYRPHYNDNTWILQKAIETCEESGYVDVYGMVRNVY